jgi:type III pantothenate kinase
MGDMLLATDIGNTNITVGVFDGEAIKGRWRVLSAPRRSSDEYWALFTAFFSSAGIRRGDISGSILCSVAPSITGPVREALSSSTGVRPLVAGEDVEPGIRVRNPAEVGIDRLVNAVGAYRAYGRALIIADLGTAATFDYVTPSGEFAGGAIAPGLSASAEALWRGAEKLPRVEIKRPERAVGRDTVEAMRAGLFYGFAGLVDGLIDALKAEAGTDPAVVATGGDSTLLVGASRHIKEADEFLTLKGLKAVYDKSRQ